MLPSDDTARNVAQAWPRTQYVDEDGLELLILPPLLSAGITGVTTRGPQVELQHLLTNTKITVLSLQHAQPFSCVLCSPQM